MSYSFVERSKLREEIIKRIKILIIENKSIQEIKDQIYSEFKIRSSDKNMHCAIPKFIYWELKKFGKQKIIEIIF